MIKLNTARMNCECRYFENALRERIIGQDRAIRTMTRVFQTWRAGLGAPDKPIANLLMLGPTGSGKTRLVEAVAEVLFEDPKAMIKIDCGEYQSGYAISKLIGSPPGYIGQKGHDSYIEPVITNDALEKYHAFGMNPSLVLFDEIEKAAPEFHQLLLGVMDKATLTLGDKTRVDFSKSIIFLTSNLAAAEMSNLFTGGIGFSSGLVEEGSNLDGKIYRTAITAASRYFSPEFMNRLDRTIVFHSLRPEHIEKILEIELNKVQDRITSRAMTMGQIFVFHCTPAAKAFIAREGTKAKYGARELKRAIDRHITSPLSNLIASGEIRHGDEVVVDYQGGRNLVFFKEEQITAFKMLPQVPKIIRERL